MGKIFYAVSGEGRGHAARARALVEDLQADHSIVLYAPDHAFDLLEPAYRHSDVEVRPLPGLQFHYTQGQRLDYFETVYRSLGYLRGLPALVRRLQDDIERASPDLIISDFEPSLPRAAKRCGMPFLSLDHQHFLLTYDLSSLPLGLRAYAQGMGQVARAFYWGQMHSVVSSFYFPPLRRGVDHVTQIGVLMRPEIRYAQPETGGHLVAYLRRFASPSTLRVLAECGVEVRIYGPGKRPDEGNLRFCEVDVQRFAEDLATCRGLVTTAGNQLVGEALYLGKPVLAFPEPGNREQEINAHFLARAGGIVTPFDQLETSHVRRLLDGARESITSIDRQRLCGNDIALGVIHRYLAAASASTPAPAAPAEALPRSA